MIIVLILAQDRQSEIVHKIEVLRVHVWILYAMFTVNWERLS